MGPDWSLLPPDLIELISGKISFTLSYVRFRAVCPSWRLATSSRLVSPLPWLMLPRDSQRNPITTFSFYDFSDPTTHQFDLPRILGNRVIVSNRSWLVLQRDKAVSLVNPITGKVKSDLIPSLACPPTILGFASNDKSQIPSYVAHSSKLNHQIQKIILTSSPYDENFYVVAAFNSQYELGFCRVGDSHWTILKLREYGYGSQHRCMSDFTCKNNFVYALNNMGHVSKSFT